MRASVVAQTGARFAGFGPYVPSVADDGRVTFQAALPDGGSGVFATDGGAPEPLLTSGAGAVDGVVSHPDVDASGRISVYVERAGGSGRAVLLVAGDRVSELARTGAGLDWIGPAGPTMDEEGHVAFRADTAGGAHGVFLADEVGALEVATTARSQWAAFQGLPLALPGGAVALRADRADGSEAIVVREADGTWRSVAETGDGGLCALGRFPCATRAGTIAFTATLSDGGGDVVVVDRGAGPEIAFDAGDRFASFRGALLGGDGTAFVLGTPRRGAGLGLFRGPDPVRDRLVAIGDDLLDSVVDDLAANPVSVNEVGQVVVRVRLADGRELVLRFDP
ncbi:MAG: hypothetical protein ACRC50_12000 [Gaiella sp.]